MKIIYTITSAEFLFFNKCQLTFQLNSFKNHMISETQ